MLCLLKDKKDSWTREENNLCQNLELKMRIQQGPKNWEQLGTKVRLQTEAADQLCTM